MAKHKKDDLYYLLPGMAKGARIKFIRNLIIGFVVGLLVAGALAAVLYYREKM
jgi:hypothetical protein